MEAVASPLAATRLMVTPLIGSARLREATDQQLIATGALGGLGVDPIDQDLGYRSVGAGSREVPRWTQERARAFSIAAYRANPMARAILDTYTSFCVGDSGVTILCELPEVKAVADEFWNDSRAPLAGLQELMLRSHLLCGESLYETMVGGATGITRWSPIDPSRINAVELDAGNPLWPSNVSIGIPGQQDSIKSIIQYDDLLGRRAGDVMFLASFKAMLTDRRGYPFLAPVLDWLDSYDAVLANLVDRTALARYLVWDVTIAGDENAIKTYLENRGNSAVPRSGTAEFHNEGVKWEAKTAEVGSFEDTNTSGAMLTNVAAGSGLAKTWLADPEHANRATSLTMAEPVRRRVGGVQNMWLHFQNEQVRYAVDNAVAVGRLPAFVDITDAGGTRSVPPSQTVTVKGPEIAAADAQVTAVVLANLAQGLTGMVAAGIMTVDAARVAARKAWEDFTGVPYAAALDDPDIDPNDLANYVDEQQPTRSTTPLAALGSNV